MPLFGSTKDARLIGSITRELFHKYISNEVEVFKIALNESEMNLYNESDSKVYYQPVRLFCNINKEEQVMNDLDTGMDVTQVLTFSFLRDDLVDKNIVISEGDIIKFDERYWEVDNSLANQYFMGRNNETHLMTTEGRDRSFGKNISIKVNTHLTRLSQLNLIQTNTGINELPKTKNFKPRNI